MRTPFLAIIVATLTAFSPSRGEALERAEMDRLLTLSRTRPDSPEFRDLLVKHLGEAPIKRGEAYNSNAGDFIWAVDAAAQPSIVIDDPFVWSVTRMLEA